MFLILGIASMGSGVRFFFCIFSPNILFIFFILFFTFSSLGYIFFLFFFPCMDLVKTTNCKLKVGQGTAQRGTRYMVKQERKGRKKKVKHFRTTSLVFFFCKPWCGSHPVDIFSQSSHYLWPCYSYCPLVCDTRDFVYGTIAVCVFSLPYDQPNFIVLTPPNGQS